jgi:DNA-binding NarL/FixJ family response regulator
MSNLQVNSSYKQRIFQHKSWCVWLALALWCPQASLAFVTRQPSLIAFTQSTQARQSTHPLTSLLQYQNGLHNDQQNSQRRTRLRASSRTQRIQKNRYPDATDVEAVEVPTTILTDEGDEIEATTTTTNTKKSLCSSNGNNNNNNHAIDEMEDSLTVDRKDTAVQTRSNKPAKENDDILLDPLVLQRHKKWIVLLDDDEAVRVSVGQFLYDAGYQVTACADAEALAQVCGLNLPVMNAKYIQSSTGNNAATIANDQITWPRLPDVLVCDIRMPGTSIENGLDLVDWLRRQSTDARWQRIPILMLTAKSLTTDRIAGYRAGANMYLTKPFIPEELLSMLDNLWRRQEEIRKSGSSVNGDLLQVQEDLQTIKTIMQQNAGQMVQRTSVYLTPTEREVLLLLSQGMTNAEIARERQVNIKNLTKMITKMNAATGTRNRTELVRWGLQTGYIPRR